MSIYEYDEEMADILDEDITVISRIADKLNEDSTITDREIVEKVYTRDVFERD